MKDFTLRKRFLDCKSGTSSLFKGFVMLVVLMLMTTSSTMAEVIDGIRYVLDSDTKTATLLPQMNGFYSGDIVVPEKVKGIDGCMYVVTALGNNCFEKCDGLTSIIIPSTVKSMGEWCFSDCSGLTSINIPSSITKLEGDCFSGCSSLKNIEIPSSVTSLGGCCFARCTSLSSITIPLSVDSLGPDCFNGCSSLKTIKIPSSVTELSYGCFNGCNSLESITIPSSVNLLMTNCFKGCSSLKTIKIPSSVTFIGGYCFEKCSNLQIVKMSSSVTFIGAYCFLDCSSLNSITIPSSINSWGNNCFSGCINLETVYFKGNVPKLYNSFLPTGISTSSIIKVPTEYLQEYKDAFGSDYKYIYAWNPNETGEDNKPVTQCSIPSVSYGEGKLMFACETTGAKYHYTITDTDIKSDALSENGEVSLSAAYNISVYATADGYKASDKAEATLYWINANLDNGTNINMVRTRGVVASAHDGIVTLSGLDNGEVVKFYATDGKYLGSSVAVNGSTSYAVNESLVIAKVGKDSIKIAVK